MIFQVILHFIEYVCLHNVIIHVIELHYSVRDPSSRIRVAKKNLLKRLHSERGRDRETGGEREVERVM